MLLDILFSIEGGPLRAPLLFFWWSHSEVSSGKSVLTTNWGFRKLEQVHIIQHKLIIIIFRSNVVYMQKINTYQILWLLYWSTNVPIIVSLLQLLIARLPQTVWDHKRLLRVLIHMLTESRRLRAEQPFTRTFTASCKRFARKRCFD